MKKFLNMLIRNWSGSPVKIILTLSAVALGSAILILTDSAGRILDEQITQELEKGGVILNVANGTLNSEGMVDQNRPAEWDSSVPDILVSDIEAVSFAVPIIDPPFKQITTEGKSYNLRSVAGSSPGYFDIFGLELAAGVSMSDKDVDMGAKKVWISRSMAELLYGSAEGAVGKWVQPPGEMMSRGPGGRDRNMIQQFSVAGVFEDPGEIARRSYGIGDLILPYTSLFSAGRNIQMMMDMMAGQLIIRAEGSSAEKISASVTDLLSSQFGYDIDILVWEGSLNGSSDYMQELRQTVQIFSVSLSILGMVLLLTSSLGIFSIMVVEALNRKRDIALERALGASQSLVVREFWSWSVMLSLAGAVLGLLIAAVLSGPVLSTLSPLVGEVSTSFSEAAGLRLLSVVRGIVLAVLFGGILGLLPSFSAVKGNIADILREA